jgi:hypothetical protein
MAKLKSKSRAFFQRTAYAGGVCLLKEVGSRAVLRTIPDEHRDRLIKAGYVREILNTYGGASVLVLTGRGLRRLSRGK